MTNVNGKTRIYNAKIEYKIFDEIDLCNYTWPKKYEGTVLANDVPDVINKTFQNILENEMEYRSKYNDKFDTNGINTNTVKPVDERTFPELKVENLHIRSLEITEIFTSIIQ